LPPRSERICRALGYEFVGELPATTDRCYPVLAPYLADYCEPEVWYWGAVGLCGFGAVGGFAVWARRNRRSKRKALELD
jgi:hypothetical protein